MLADGKGGDWGRNTLTGLVGIALLKLKERFVNNNVRNQVKL